MKDEELRERMGQRARETVRKRFLMIRLLEQYLELLNSFETVYQLTDRGIFMSDKQVHDDVPLIFEESLERIEADDIDAERELAPQEFFDTQHGEGHTYNPQQAQDQGLTYTPPTDPPVIPSEDEPQGVEIAAGFAPSMEESGPHAEDLPPRIHGSDLDLQEDIYLALRYNSETVHLEDIKVRVNNGVVDLLGTVFSEDDIARVYDIVSDLDGVVEVRSHLQIEE